MTTNLTNWLKIDKNNLPKGEVVAVCFDETQRDYYEKNVGHLILNDNTGRVLCIGEGSILFEATHYLPLPKDEEREG